MRCLSVTSCGLGIFGHLLLDADKKLLIVALTGGGVAQDGRQARLDDVLEALEDARVARAAAAEEVVDGLVDAIAGLQVLSVPTLLSFFV